MAVGMSSGGVGRTIFVNSGAVTASGATPDMSLPANATLYNIVPACEAVDIILDVTANSGVASSINPQFVELQDSPDGGAHWYCFWRSANLTTSTTVVRTAMRTNGIGANEAAASTTTINTATAAVTQNRVVCANQRVVWTLSTTSGNSPSLTFGIYAVVQQSGTRASY